MGNESVGGPTWYGHWTEADGGRRGAGADCCTAAASLNPSVRALLKSSDALAFRLRCIAARSNDSSSACSWQGASDANRFAGSQPCVRALPAASCRRPILHSKGTIALKPLHASTVSFSSDATELWSCHIAGASRFRVSPPCSRLAALTQSAFNSLNSRAVAAASAHRPAGQCRATRPSPPSAVAATAGRRLIDLECRAHPSLSRWPLAERQSAQLRRFATCEQTCRVRCRRFAAGSIWADVMGEAPKSLRGMISHKMKLPHTPEG